MNAPASTIPISAGQPGEGLKSFLKLLKEAAPTSAAPPAVQPGEFSAQLAYKLAQAASKASDPELLKTSVTGLLDALTGINKSLSGEE